MAGNYIGVKEASEIVERSIGLKINGTHVRELLRINPSSKKHLIDGKPIGKKDLMRWILRQKKIEVKDVD